tara:strand:+ start:1266 stop:1823 length:558 start_codon:yes stop_codon:yes gene_type:complete
MGGFIKTAWWATKRSTSQLLGVPLNPNSYVEFAIRDLAIRYAVAVDDCDLPSVLNKFTKSGSFERAGQKVEGQEELSSFFTGMMDRYILTRHLIHMHTVEVSRRRVSGVVHGSAELVLDDTLYLSAFRWHDLYELEAGEWKFSNRQLKFIYYMPATELANEISAVKRVRIPGAEPQTSEHLNISS